MITTTCDAILCHEYAMMMTCYVSPALHINKDNHVANSYDYFVNAFGSVQVRCYEDLHTRWLLARRFSSGYTTKI